MTLGTPHITRYLTASIVFLLLGLADPASTAQAQFWSDEEPIEEVVVIGHRDDAFAGFGSVFHYLDFLDASMNSWLEQLGNALDAAMETADDPDVVRSCAAQQTAFRTECLELAHRASQACIVSGGSLTAFAAFFGGLPGATVGITSALTCSEANFQAVNACNIAADQYTFPDANPICQLSSN